VVDGAPAGLLLRVDKPALRLAVYRAGRPAPDAGGAWCYPVALGASPSGDKHHQGDERTPEGVFRVTHRNPASSFHLSLGLDYPQPRHAEVALAEGRITRAQYDRVVAAARNRAPPPGDTPLGGDIYLHGGGVWPSTWTDGCIAVTNEVIDHLYAIAGPGTAVWVEG
jgi:murein L,D-transpeptidase YafK